MPSVSQVLSTEFRFFLVRVRLLNLSPIAYHLMYASTGPEWTSEQTTKAITRYLAFQYLIHQYPHLCLIPTFEICQVWQSHLFDKQKYTEDCQHLFGSCIFPSAEQEGDRPDHLRATILTQVLFRKHFGRSLVTES
ncbi:MAG TPA: glycine-rich domain-containing protein-like [Trichocoleus sp.]